MLDLFHILTVLYQILKSLTNLFGSHSSVALKLLRQMALIGEADL